MKRRQLLKALFAAPLIGLVPKTIEPREMARREYYGYDAPPPQDYPVKRVTQAQLQDLIQTTLEGLPKGALETAMSQPRDYRICKAFKK